MNIFDDVRRRVFFMQRELGLQGRGDRGYEMHIAKHLWDRMLVEGGHEVSRWATGCNTFLGFPFVIVPTDDHNLLKLVHEVRG